jgi:hypothetical protein
MKMTLSLLLVFISVTVFGQSTETQPAADTSRVQNFKGTTCYSYSVAKKKFNPLVIVDGKRKRRLSRKMGVHHVESIKIIKGDEAVEQYGEAGKNGVIVVVTNRKQYRKKMS